MHLISKMHDIVKQEIKNETDIEILSIRYSFDKDKINEFHYTNKHTYVNIYYNKWHRRLRLEIVPRTNRGISVRNDFSHSRSFFKYLSPIYLKWRFMCRDLEKYECNRDKREKAIKEREEAYMSSFPEEIDGILLGEINE